MSDFLSKHISIIQVDVPNVPQVGSVNWAKAQLAEAGVALDAPIVEIIDALTTAVLEAKPRLSHEAAADKADRLAFQVAV